MKLNIIFMGTPEFAKTILNAISLKHNITLVVTQPDTYNRKTHSEQYSPCKEWAVEHNVEVFQPEKIRLDYEKVLNTPCDLIVTAAYGQIIGEEILNYPKYKCINVHGSILPKYRGGAPIQRAIMNGDKETGITIMYMDKRMDAGDILRIEKTPILDSDNNGSIFDKLSEIGANIINDVIDDLVNNKLTPIKQDESEVSFAKIISKDEELLDFNKDSTILHNTVRGLNPNPGCYFYLDGMMIKVHLTKVSSNTHNGKVGVITSINKKSFEISCGNGTVLEVLELQMPGKGKVKAVEFINGQGRKLIYIGKELK